jgi:hypothetical protein
MTKYPIEIYPDISISQTFDEQGYKRKTLHALNDLHEGATISKANTANFSFTTPITNLSNSPVLLSLGTSYSEGNVSNFDMYIESDNVMYKVEKCVIASTTFNISNTEILTVSISGSASKIIPFTGKIPGTLLTQKGDYFGTQRLSVSIGGTVIDSIAALNVEFANKVRWLENNTLQISLTNNISYSEQYVIEGRTVSGSITEFLTSQNKNALTDTSTNAAVDIIVGTASIPNLLRFTLPSTVFTRRISVEDLITRVYDFRLNTNTTTVKPIYKGV